MPGLQMFKKSFYSHVGANEPIVAGTIKLGSTKGRGSSTRIFNYCTKRSAVPSLCINQFITITNGTATNSSKPLAPILTSIQTGNTKLTIFYTAPSNFIESNITDYQYSIDNGNTFTNMGTTTSPYTINGLINNTTYTIIIRAVNAAGFGINSNSLQGIPCVWEAFGNGLTGSVIDQVRALEIDNNYNTYVTGAFNSAGDISANFVAKWNGNITTPYWSELNYGVYAVGSSVEVDPTNNNNVYFGGGFTSAGDPPLTVNRIAKWDGNQWSSLGSGVGTMGSVLSIATNNNIVYAGGSFANFLQQWNGVSWQSLGAGVDNVVSALAFNQNNELYVGGSFTNAGGLSNTRGIAKWDGSQWSSLGNGLISGAVLCISFDPTNPNNIYVGGAISDAGGVPVNNIAKWDGTSWYDLGGGVNDSVRGVCVDSNGNVYAGGSFTNAGGIPVNYLAKWNGTSWSELDGGVGGGEFGQTFVYSLKIDSLDNIYVGGRFSVAGTITANCIAKYNTF